MLRGAHSARAGTKDLRGSDQTELIGAAAVVLKASGWSEKEVCLDIASNPKVRLGKSRRGRPAKKRRRPRDLLSKAEIVRSILNRHRLHDPALLARYYVGLFRWLRQNGIVEGSEYAADSGRRSIEAWRRIWKSRGIDPTRWMFGTGPAEK